MPSVMPLCGIRKAASVLPVALPAQGYRPTPSICRPVVLLTSGIGSNADVLPRGSAALPRGKRCWPRAAPIKSGRDAPASCRRAAGGIAGPVTRKALLTRPDNTGGQDRLQASGRWPTCRRSRSVADMPPPPWCCCCAVNAPRR